MASASDQPSAAGADASAPNPNPSSHLQRNGAGVGKLTPTSITSPPPPTPSRPPPPHTAVTAVAATAHGLDFANSPCAHSVKSSSSTSTIADYESPPAQIVSDVRPAAAGPVSTSATPSASESPSLNNFAVRPFPNVQYNGNSSNTTLPGASHTPNSTHSLPKGGTNLQAWSSSPPPSQIPSFTPVRAPTVVETATGTGQPSSTSRKTVGFPSPKSESMQTNQKFLDDCDRIKFGIQQALPEAARRSVRDHWEKCLLGSPFHQAFVLNASIHHATPAAIQRGMRDFGKTLIASGKKEIVEQMTTHDLDQLADLILSKASVAFYDKCLEKRLKTIDAKRLINALARAERLGYEVSDVQEEEEDENTPPVGQPQVQPQPAPALSTTGPILHCGMCFRHFPAKSAYNYHVKHKVCKRSPNSPDGFKYNCQHCGQGFTTPMGLQYHNTNQVCGDFGEPTNPSFVKKSNIHATTPAPTSGPHSQMSMPRPSLPSHVTTLRSSPATPSTPKTMSRAPSPAGTPNASVDPYSHLSPEQLAALQSELREAELAFSERMRQANLIIDPAEKKAKFEGLGNSFGTKQSIIRKKYGVRLRQRRTKTEIQQERNRMQYKTASEIQAEMGVGVKGPGRPPASSDYSSSYRSEVKTAVAGNGWAPVNQSPTTTLVTSNIAKPASKTTASNDGSMHGQAKRRFSGSGETPDIKRVAYADMGGLSGVNLAEAETKDPTMSKGGAGTKEEPMALDDSSGDENDGDDSDSSDEDIPAELPASVKQTLMRSSPAGGENRSRLQSSSVAVGI